ncbi:MAG TPA: histone deacetylase family protein [Alphaproteobacteria bacterium]|jgi:acetoin utilization deacetylase AcuC-like enzyme|nr:histone deacetylase family protein [Alphaproteobacteria bacterium]
MAITEIITHQDCYGHNPGEGHPESPARLKAIVSVLEKNFPESGTVIWKEAPLASKEQILYCHTESHFENLKTVTSHLSLGDDPVSTDVDTRVSQGSFNAALRGAGAACMAVDDVYHGRVKNAFCVVRPPGHHALKNATMGFCLFGNAAIAAFHALTKDGIDRVVIVDFDVHHGNGTQDLVENNPDILLFSTHQDDLWPYQGQSTDVGVCGNIRNIPVPIHSDPQLYRDIFEQKILPEINSFKPDFIIISAGFDAHRDDPPADQLFNDPAGRQMLTEADFNWMTSALLRVADVHANGRVVSVLEGGYNVDVLSSCCSEHVNTLSSAYAVEMKSAS